MSSLLAVFMALALPYVIHIHRETGRWMISKKALDAQARLLAFTTEGQGAVEKGMIQRQKALRKG